MNKIKRGVLTLRISLIMVISLFLSSFSFAQETNILEEYSLKINDINDNALTAYLNPKIEQSQFVLLGESHGIVEVGEITDHLYGLAKPFGFNTFCIETDPLVAKVITGFHESGNSLQRAKTNEIIFPWTIPFYNNVEDYKLLNHVLDDGGALWGIDQSMMAQIRLSFDYLAKNTNNKALRVLAETQRKDAMVSYNEAITTKNFSKAYVFKYSEDIHNELMAKAKEPWEQSILEDLRKTKEIYNYQFSGQYYLNNSTRAQLMKSNFMDYMKATGSEDTKVLFKLVYNHTVKGLTFTSVYDIGNMVSELADSKGKRSLHVLAMAISGNENRSNPVETNKISQPVNYSNYLPKALYDFSKASSDKYVVIKAEELRPIASKLDIETQKFIFKYDVIILINDATPLTNF